MSQYRAYFAPGAMDPSGKNVCLNPIVKLEFIPQSSPENVPWSRANLPEGTLARTKTKIDVDCTCSKCFADTDKCCYKPTKCSIRVEFHIQMDMRQIRKNARFNIVTAYGHEQRHVQNSMLSAGFVQLHAWLLLLNEPCVAETKSEPGDPQELKDLHVKIDNIKCKTAATKFALAVHKNLNLLEDVNGEHKFPHPVDGRGYDPMIGELPRNPLTNPPDWLK